MKKLSRALLSATLTLVGLSILASSAFAASGVSISPGGAITATSLGRLTSQGSLGTLACNVTLTGSLTRGLISIPSGGLSAIGSITGGSATNCELNGSRTTVTLNFSPAWTLAANSNGLVVVLGATFSASICTYRGNVLATPDLSVSPVVLLITQASPLAGSPAFPCGSTTILAGQGFSLTPGQIITLLP